MTFKACSAEGCARVARSRGLCENHYTQWRYATIPEERERKKARGRAYAKRRYATDPVYRAEKATRSKLYGARFRVIGGILVEVPTGTSPTGNSNGAGGAGGASPAPETDVRATRGLRDRHGGASG